MLIILHPDGRLLPLDVVTDYSISRTASAAEHPMEEGAPVVDHVELKNEVHTFGCAVTETPSDTQRDFDGAALGFGVTDVLTGRTGLDRIEAAVAFLNDCVGYKVDAWSSSGRFAAIDLLLTSWPTQQTIIRKAEFTLTFLKPRFVTLENVPVPPRKAVPAEVSSETQEADKGTEEVTEDPETIAHNMLGGTLDAVTGGSQ